MQPPPETNEEAGALQQFEGNKIPIFDEKFDAVGFDGVDISIARNPHGDGRDYLHWTFNAIKPNGYLVGPHAGHRAAILAVVNNKVSGPGVLITLRDLPQSACNHLGESDYSIDSIPYIPTNLYLIVLGGKGVGPPC
jgi:hypothetical protein